MSVRSGRSPRSWIDDEDGSRRPVKDLLAPGRFLLIAGEDGHAWCEAARQITGDGAILVRPDRFIAWRHQAGAAGPRAALAAALSQVLARPVDAPVASAV